MKAGHLFVACVALSVLGGCALTDIDECHGDEKSCQDNKLMRCEHGKYVLDKDCVSEGLVCDAEKFECTKSLVCERGCNGQYINECDEFGKSKITDCGENKLCVRRGDEFSCETTVACVTGRELFDAETNTCTCHRENGWIATGDGCGCEDGFLPHGEICDRDTNKNHMWDALEISHTQGTSCVNDEVCNSAQDVDVFCDSFLGNPTEGGKCGTKCRADSDCVDAEVYFCRADGRCAPRTFETVWKIVDASKPLYFPGGAGECDYVIDWGDGSAPLHIDKCSPEGVTHEHTYAAAGEYHIKVTGLIDGWSCGAIEEDPIGMEYLPTKDDRDLCEGWNDWDDEDEEEEDEEDDDDDDDEDEDEPVTPVEKDPEEIDGGGYCKRLVSVESFGPVGLGVAAFGGAFNLERISHVDIPDATKLKSLKWGFSHAQIFNDDVSNWDTSQVEDMAFVFYAANKFNHPLNNWNTSQVKDLSYAFASARAFNQPLDKWDVSKVRKMAGMFRYAKVFNQNLSKWSVNEVRDMSRMFDNAHAFNQNLEDWHTYNVTNMSRMFRMAVKFNQPFRSSWDEEEVMWDVESVKDMSYMFEGASSFDSEFNGEMIKLADVSGMFKDAKKFNQEIKWEIGCSLKNTSFMFSGATSFNQSLDSLCMTNVTDMRGMFEEAKAFNQPVNHFDTENVTDMSDMFNKAEAFNQPVDKFDTSNVTDMSGMFYGAKSFNQPVNAFDTSSVTNMNHMFYGAESFNQPLDGWDLTSLKTVFAMFYGAKSFEQDLTSWDISEMCYAEMFYGSVKLMNSSKGCALLKSENWEDLDLEMLGGEGVCHKYPVGDDGGEDEGDDEDDE